MGGCSQEQASRLLLQVHEAQGFESAFHQATGLRVVLRPLPVLAEGVGTLALDNPVCQWVVSTEAGRALCAQKQAQLRQAMESGRQVEPFCCVAGLTVLAVPVRVCGEPVAMLHTNRLLVRRPDPGELEAASAQLRSWGAAVTPEAMAEAMANLVVLEGHQVEAVAHLLRIYAEHLGDLASRRILADRQGQPCALAQALAYIKEHHRERLPLREVARRVNLSPYYFCKLFHRTMGMTFTQYLTRVRLERAKDLLLNPSLSVSEVASAVGFGSIPHFNRSFKRYTGMTPTAYRAMRLGRSRSATASPTWVEGVVALNGQIS
jgi:AraC-like DNA-binding protein/ligand-binding sensor protein